MAGMLAEEDPALAWRHARAARSKGGRIAVVRETVGLVAYHAGEWAEAISELRAARRMTGGPGQLPVMADCERALGHPEKAIELSRSAEAADLDPSSAAELRIVVAGARADLGQLDAAIAHLEGALQPGDIQPFSARLFYAYADLLLQADRHAEAVDWFMKAAEADVDEETDAGERLTELAGEIDGPGEIEDSVDPELSEGAEISEADHDLDDEGDEEFDGESDIAADPNGLVGSSTVAELDQEALDEDALDEAEYSDDAALGEEALAGVANGENSDDIDDGSDDLVVSDDGSDDDGQLADEGDLESNAAADADEDVDGSEDRYAANDMDAEDDTDEAPIRPANAPRSMGSLFSHNEGGL